MFSSIKSLSFVFVELTTLYVCGKSPVLNDPDPAYVFAVVFGEITPQSPTCTTPPEETLITFKVPKIAGIWFPPLLVRNLLLAVYAGQLPQVRQRTQKAYPP
jgi:hypothetical protein